MDDKPTFTDAIKNVDSLLGDIPEDSAGVAASATQDDAVVFAGGSKDIGKPGGWTGTAGAGFGKKSGWFAAVKLWWTGK